MRGTERLWGSLPKSNFALTVHRAPHADKDDAEQLWRSFRRTGLQDQEALALLGFHPFVASWADPAAAEAADAAGPPRFDNTYYRSNSRRFNIYF